VCFFTAVATKLKPLNVLTAFLFLISSVVAHASVGEPQSAWKKRAVSVCWGTAEHAMSADLPRISKMLIEHSEYDPFRFEDKLQVRETITREINLKTAGIELVGWEDCAENDPSDVMVFTEDLTQPPKHKTDLMFVTTYHGCSSIGDDSEGSSLKRFVHIKKLPDFNLKISSSQALDLIALHEFGHLVGLRHEHARRFEASGDANCFSQGIGLMESLGTSAKIYGDYDPNSIMNYCHDFSLMNKTGVDFYVYGLSDHSMRLDQTMDFGNHSSIKKFNPNEVNFLEGLTVIKTPAPELNATRVQVSIGLSESDRVTLRSIYHAKF